MSGNHSYVGLKLQGSRACWAKLISRLQSPNRLGVTSVIIGDCQRLSRVLSISGIERKQSELPFESPTMVRCQEEKWILSTQIWIVIKQSTNLELNEPVLEWK